MENERHSDSFSGRWYAHPVVRNALLAGVLTGITFGLAHAALVPPAVEIALFLAAIVLGGYHWAREGIEEFLKEREVGIEILMLAAVIGSSALGMWDEAAFLVVLYGLAEGLEEYTYAKTRASIRGLLDLAPKEARVVRGGVETRVAATELRVDDVLLVKPGEAIPTDGIILKGRSSLNEAPVTGESMPVEKQEGMKVFAATINQEGALEIRVTARFEDNTLSKMIHLVEEAQEQKGKTQLFIDRFSRIYSPIVLLAAFLLIVVPLLFGFPFAIWARKAVVLLVAAAPCALVMSTPVAIAAGIGTAGRHGVLIKGGVHLESLGRIRLIAFDKTGTLTRGLPVVTDVIPIHGTEPELLNLAYSIERFSEHPLAKAVVQKAVRQGARDVNATDFSAITGYGAKATIAGQTIYVGKPALFDPLFQEPGLEQKIETLRAEGKTIMFVGLKTAVQGVIAVRDVLRPDAQEAIRRLHQLGMKTVMLTGDNAVTASAIAKELGIDDVRADLRPEEKMLAIKQLRQTHGAVAMVGDGINDAPALAAATIGIAMGVSGSDTAIETADTALMADDLMKLIYAVRLGKNARAISRQNIVGSLALLAVLIPSALAGILNIAVAVIFHEGSELLAVANGLRTARA